MVEQILSHSTYMAIGIIAVIMIMAALYGFKADVQEAYATVKLNYIADSVQNKVLEMKDSGSDFEARIKIDADGYLLTLSNNLITVRGNGVEVTRTVDAQMSGEEYLPAYLAYKGGTVVVE